MFAFSLLEVLLNNEVVDKNCVATAENVNPFLTIAFQDDVNNALGLCLFLSKYFFISQVCILSVILHSTFTGIWQDSK